jgi:dTDP-4-dehydrorhamnose reductase
MKNTLILGDGLLGSELVKQTNWDYISRKKDGIDIDDFETLSQKLTDYKTIVNCIANTDTYSQELGPHIKANYKFVRKLVDYCNQENKKLIHISTDYLYENSKEDASENDVLYNYSPYLITKHAADVYITHVANDYLICRLSHKPYPFPYEFAWTDVVTNADYTPVIASLVVELIEKNATGLYNVGTEKKTIYELALKSVEAKPTLSPKHIPKNVSMDIRKMKNFLNL